MNTISGLYRRKYGRMLDYWSLGFAKMTAFVAEIPGLELVNGAAGGSVRLARAAPIGRIYARDRPELEGARRIPLSPDHAAGWRNLDSGRSWSPSAASSLSRAAHSKNEHLR